ncbi:hypothetical protein K501DRAFT_325744 [Backusella circina FSU 941]|nr:hypothetical protein K501DRAFT_325744 [Backusella circina FSU 941]
MRPGSSAQERVLSTTSHRASLPFFSSRRSNSNAGLRGIHINISSDPFQHRIPPYIQRLWQESKLRRQLSLTKRRLVKRYYQTGWLQLVLICVGLFFSCIILLVHVGFFSGKKYQDLHHDHFHQDKEFEQIDLLDKVYPDEGRGQTTAIIFLPQDNQIVELDANVKPILQQLCQYDMFATLTVWNDDSRNTITLDMIQVQGCIPSRLSVINAPVNLGQSSRYHACRLARTPYCYFQDRFREGDYHLRSVYANFLRSPQLIHGEATSTVSFFNSQWRYCYSNEDYHLHTCFMDMESGVFVAKETVSRFLLNYDENFVNDTFADLYFASYMNQIPYQLEGQGNYVKALSVDEKEHLDASLTILYNDLVEEGNEGTVAIEPFTDSRYQQNARATCSNDRCLFLTNKQLFPNISIFTYNPNINIDLSADMHNDYYHHTPTSHYYYTYAVDNDDQTAWRSLDNIHSGDYIGLDLLMPMRNPLRYRFLVHLPYIYSLSLELQISYDGLDWMKLHPSPSLHCESTENELLDCRFIVTDTGYRYIRLQSQKDLDFPFELHDISFSAKVKKDANGQLLDIGFDDDGVGFVEDDDS